MNEENEVDYHFTTNIKSDNPLRNEFEQEAEFQKETPNFLQRALAVPEQMDKFFGIHDARQDAIKAATFGLSEQHWVAALAGEMLIPDSLDLITLGLGYIPRRILKGGGKAIKAFLKAKKGKFATKSADTRFIGAAQEAGIGTKVAGDADYDAMAEAARKLEAEELNVAEKLGKLKTQTPEQVLAESGKRQYLSVPPPPKGKGGKIVNPNTPSMIPLQRGIKGKAILNSNQGIFANLSNNTKILGEQIIDELDKFHEQGLLGKIKNWDLNRPTFQYKGKRRLPYVKPDGTPGEYYFNWSKSQQTYVPRDIDSMLAAKAKRAKWNVTTGGKNKAVREIYKSSKEANEALVTHLRQLLDDDPIRAQKILGGTGDQIIYVEHIHAQKSPFWNKPRPFKPRDPENLVIIEDDIFPKVKTAIEKQLYSSDRYKDVYIDMSLKPGDTGYNMALKNAKNDELIGIIPGMTNKSQVKASIYRALTKKDPLSIEDINPDIRRYLDEMHGITRETAERLPDAKAGKFAEKAQNPYESLNREIENISTHISDMMSGDAPMINAQAMTNLKKQLKSLEQERNQLRLFSTSGDKTGLRIQQQKIKIAKPKRVKRRVDEGQIDPKMQIPEEFRGPKYGKPKK
tara:strand:- start:48 stop:1931 length:1884 start_codon:yes stop_codon:yes gene_type:complete